MIWRGPISDSLAPKWPHEKVGIAALVRSLGYADALRFVVQLNPGQEDYLQWSEQALGDIDVDELYEKARRHWEHRKTWLGVVSESAGPSRRAESGRADQCSTIPNALYAVSEHMIRSM